MVLKVPRMEEPRRVLPRFRGWIRKFSSFLRFQTYRSDEVSVSSVIVSLDGTGDFDDIQAAIDSLPDSGGKVLIKQGTYNIYSSILIISNNIFLEGSGENTIITSSSVLGDTILVNGASQIRIESIFINGNSTLQTGIHIKDTSDTSVFNCWINDINGEGIITGKKSGGDLSNISIVSCRIWGNQSNGIQFESTDNSFIDRNSVYQNELTGIILTNCNECIISNNIVYENDFSNTGQEDGIRIRSSDNNTISHNRVYANDQFEIFIFDSDSEKNIVTYNNVTLSASSTPIVDNGTSTQIAHNITD